ncbi:MAG: hypothetical protein NC343_08495 [Muribaculum sp.]|nr:hypothetical protein [Muribaculaceae bacterium]MCM1081774.1 hypothetical protein [Muribaculum sp.]
MEYCYNQSEHSKYLLACDDDVEFCETFVEDLLKIAEQYQIDTLVPIRDYRAPLLKNVISALRGERTENTNSHFKITIKTNGRFSVNNSLKENVNPSQSGPFQCFLMRTDITPKLKLRDEMWLDETRYALPDDQVFFYKAYLLGLRTYSCKQPWFNHLDGKSGTTDSQRLKDVTYSAVRNITIFWHKFIKSQKNSKVDTIKAKINFTYYVTVNKMICIAKGLVNRDLSLYREFIRGVNDGKAYMNTHPTPTAEQ